MSAQIQKPRIASGGPMMSNQQAVAAQKTIRKCGTSLVQSQQQSEPLLDQLQNFLVSTQTQHEKAERLQKKAVQQQDVIEQQKRTVEGLRTEKAKLQEYVHILENKVQAVELTSMTHATNFSKLKSDAEKYKRQLEATEKLGDELARWRSSLEEQLRGAHGMVENKSRQHDQDKKECQAKMEQLECTLQNEKAEHELSKTALRASEDNNRSIRAALEDAKKSNKNHEDEISRLSVSLSQATKLYADLKALADQSQADLLSSQREAAMLKGSIDAEKKTSDELRTKLINNEKKYEKQVADTNQLLLEVRRDNDRKKSEIEILTREVQSKTAFLTEAQNRVSAQDVSLGQARSRAEAAEAESLKLLTAHETMLATSAGLLDSASSIETMLNQALSDAKRFTLLNVGLTEKIALLEATVKEQATKIAAGVTNSSEQAKEQQSQIESLRKQLSAAHAQVDAAMKAQESYKKNCDKFNEQMSTNRDKAEKEKAALKHEVTAERVAKESLAAQVESVKTEMEKLEIALQAQKEKSFQLDNTAKELKKENQSLRKKELKSSKALEKAEEQAAAEKQRADETKAEMERAAEAERVRVLETEKQRLLEAEQLRAAEEERQRLEAELVKKSSSASPVPILCADASNPLPADTPPTTAPPRGRPRKDVSTNAEPAKKAEKQTMGRGKSSKKNVLFTPETCEDKPESDKADDMGRGKSSKKNVLFTRETCEDKPESDKADEEASQQAEVQEQAKKKRRTFDSTLRKYGTAGRDVAPKPSQKVLVESTPSQKPTQDSVKSSQSSCGELDLFSV